CRKLGLRVADLFLDFFFVDQFVFATSDTSASALTTLSSTLITPIETSASAARTSAIAATLLLIIRLTWLLLNGDTFPFPFFIFNETGIIIHRQINFTEDTRTLD